MHLQVPTSPVMGESGPIGTESYLRTATGSHSDNLSTDRHGGSDTRTGTGTAHIDYGRTGGLRVLAAC